VAAVRKNQPRAGAGHEPARRRAETTQPFESGAAGWRKPSRELRDLSSVAVCRAERPSGKFWTVGRAEHPCADRIGPQHLAAIGRPQPCRKRAYRMRGEPRIAGALQLGFPLAHDRDLNDLMVVDQRGQDAGRAMAVLTKRYDYCPPAWAGPRFRRSKAGKTLILELPSNPSTGLALNRNTGRGPEWSNRRMPPRGNLFCHKREVRGQRGRKVGSLPVQTGVAR
jgi:hypothetical protein